MALLFLMADKSEKNEASKATPARDAARPAFGVYLIACGRHIGSGLGPGVTAPRSQLSGRICHRVNDPQTANATLGDMDPNAPPATT